MTDSIPSESRLARLKELALKTPQSQFFGMPPDVVLALVECAEALKWMHPRSGVWQTPNDAQVSFAEAAIAKLEAL